MLKFEKYNIDDASISTPRIIKNNTPSEGMILRQKQRDEEKAIEEAERVAKYKSKYSVAFNYKFTCPFCLAVTNLYHANRHISNKSCITQRFYREKLLTQQNTFERFKIWLNSKRRRISESDYKGDDEYDKKLLMPIITGVDEEDEIKTIQNINIRLKDKINMTTTQDELKYFFKTIQTHNRDIDDFLKRDFKQIIYDNLSDDANDIINDYDNSDNNDTNDTNDYNEPLNTKQGGGASKTATKSKQGSKKATTSKAGSKKAGSKKTGSKKTGSKKTGSKKTGSKRSDNITCECGAIVRYDGIARHRKTTAHLNRVDVTKTAT